MAHLGWIYGVGGYIGGILTMLYGPVGKYSLDQANELKELIVEIKRAISNFENHPLLPLSVSGSLSLSTPPLSLPSVRVDPAFSKYASDLKSKLELIRWYGLIRLIRLVRLPSKKSICEAAELLPQLSLVELGDQPRQEALSIAKKIMKLLA